MRVTCGCGHVVSVLASSCPSCGEPRNPNEAHLYESRPCPVCHGSRVSGTGAGEHSTKCDYCSGTGATVVKHKSYDDPKWGALCPVCKGSGGKWVDRYVRGFLGIGGYLNRRDHYETCGKCHGKGSVGRQIG